jgi:acetyl esterase/lipase
VKPVAVVVAGMLALASNVSLIAQGGQTGRGGGPARAGALPVPQEIRLWEEGAPGALGTADADVPILSVFRAARGATGTGVVVAPGGGYGALAMDHEGLQVAAFLNGMGVHAFVLRYRLGPRYRHPVQIGDARRAIRVVRSRAPELGVQPDRIGMMGFSAGGHLTATAGVHAEQGRTDAADPVERVSSRPDFLILGYPVISFDPAITHGGSVRNLLGESPDPALVALLSTERHVTPDTPPTFLFHTSTDTAVPAEHSVRFYLALVQAGVPAELHVFEQGPHGVGLAFGDPSLGAWPRLLTQWLRVRGLLTAAPR